MSELAFITDNDWRAIEGELCRVKDFTPSAEVVNGEVRASNMRQYATIEFECPRLTQGRDRLHYA